MDSVNVNEVAEGLKKFLVTVLSDIETGPFSDTGFVRAESTDDGDTLELFDTGDETAWPVASFDIAQLANELAVYGYRKEGV